MKGVKLIFTQLDDLTKKEGVQKISPLGEKFDPNLHEALSHIPSEDEEENTIVGIIQNGYKLKDKLIRPARVAVSSGKIDKVATETKEEK